MNWDKTEYFGAVIASERNNDNAAQASEDSLLGGSPIIFFPAEESDNLCPLN